MLDLACHAWAPRLTPLTAAMVKPFVVLDRRFPAVRRHGYLIAAVGEKRDPSNHKRMRQAPTRSAAPPSG